MYGLVNRAIKELIEQTAGPELWTRVREQAGYAEAGFEDLEAYPDALTYALVGAASELLETPAEDLLRAFGKHWVLFTGRSEYADLMDADRQDLEAFLHSLNDLHRTVAERMPELSPPSFGVDEEGDALLVYYVSDREGLSPMVVGLLEGLVELFGAKASVRQLEDTPHGEQRFLIDFRYGMRV